MFMILLKNLDYINVHMHLNMLMIHQITFEFCVNIENYEKNIFSEKVWMKMSNNNYYCTTKSTECFPALNGVYKISELKKAT